MKPTAVNVITGFLGVGKTTAILNLLQQKPDDELWAILVNEFGEIGVDGGLLKGQAPARDDVMVFEIPGGCMCCAAGLPMEMALSQLFFLASPDRLIIEPTGLGHPAEVLSVLASRFNGLTMAVNASANGWAAACTDSGAGCRLVCKSYRLSGSATLL